MTQTVFEDGTEASRIQAGLRKLTSHYPNAFRVAKFATGSGIGFLDSEIVLALGTYLLYRQLSPPRGAFFSPLFIAINVIAFVVGVTVAFFINESLIARGEGRKISYSFRSVLVRLGKFQLIFLAGNLVMVAVELILLKSFGFPAELGLILGAIVSFPISYFFSMNFIWEIKAEKVVINRGTKDLSPVRSKKIKLPQLFPRNPISTLPKHLVTPYGNYDVKIQEYRFDVYPVTGHEDTTTGIEFALKVDVEPEG